MKRIYLPLPIVCLLASFLLLPVVKAGNGIAKFQAVRVNTGNTIKLELAATALYDSLQLNKLGLAKDAMLYAYEGQQKLAEQGELDNPDVLTVCDFSQPSNQKRMYIIDIKSHKILFNTYVAHGKNSGLEYAERFSNKLESEQSSLGFYITKNTYVGKHGTSLKLEGLDKGFNDNAEARAVVVHGAAYVGDKRLGTYMGRSFGCPAVPQAHAPKVINLIKNGTCLFIYHPSDRYLHGSTVLNG